MSTLIDRLKNGDDCPEISAIALDESVDPAALADSVLAGKVAVPRNISRDFRALGIGSGLRTKVNANLGTSMEFCSLEEELTKVKVALAAGADTVMDLSTGGDLRAIRAAILQQASVPLGTVPIYQTAVDSQQGSGAIIGFTGDDLFKTIEEQARQGVDFMTVHCGVTRSVIDALTKQGRVADVVSRGGAFLIAWIIQNDKENPLYAQFDRLLEIASRYDVTLSLGDGLRPGCLADASDRAQLQELITLGELVKKARQANVQVIVEGPGHMPYDQIEANMRMEKELCDGAPFYVLGPLVTDIAAGYDHINAAIGGTLAAIAGADYLCFVTPREHLGLPTVEDIHEGVMASRIAAHAADIVKKVPGAWERDLQMAQARKGLDWQAQVRLSLDPAKAERMRRERQTTGEACTMCSDFCAMKLVAEHLGTPGKIVC